MRIERGGWRDRTEATLLFTLGAIGGLLLGAALADRLGGLDGVRTGVDRTKPRRHRRDGWRGDTRRSAPFDDLADDDSELAPESITHLHVHDHSHDPLHDPLEGRDEEEVPAPRARLGSVDLEAQVLAAFRLDPHLANRSIDITVEAPHTVTLTGWVADAREQRLAETVALGVPGVHDVRSELAVLRAR